MSTFKLARTVATLAMWAAATGAGAAVLYDNGPCNCQAASYSIAGGNYVFDTFTISASATVTGVSFVAWNYPTSSVTTSIDWAIFSGLKVPYGPNTPLIASGTALLASTYLLTNTSGYAVNTDSFAIPSTLLGSGTYSLVLANAHDNYGADNIRWDVNSGPSTALVRTNFGPFEGYQLSNAFQVLGSVSGAVPEPATWALLLVGFGLVGVLLRRQATSGVFAGSAVMSTIDS